MDTVKINKNHALMIAHRGLSSLECENTCAAFVAAGNRSYYGIETDIHETSDNNFVLIHDDSTGRVAKEDYVVQDTDYNTLRSLELTYKGESRTDLRIPSLEEHIEICKKYGKASVLELKNTMNKKSIAKIIDRIKALNYLDNTIFISFSLDNLTAVRKILPNASVQYLTTRFDNEILKNLVKYRMDIDILYTALTEKDIDIIHKAGIKVNCWTVDKKEEAERLAEWGVDYITTNILE